jgi:membrane-associated phospholipid phosphatase
VRLVSRGSLEDAAQLVAEHAVPALLGVTVALGLVTALLWRVVVVVSPRLVPLFQATFGRFVGPGRYLSVLSFLSFVVTLAAVGALVELVDEIEVDEGLARFDVALSSALAREVGDGTLRAFAIVTRLADPPVLIVVSLLAAVVLLVRREALVAWSLLFTTAGGALLNRTLKALFGRARPIHEHGFVTEDGLSFPSGHAAGSMVVYGFLCYLLVRHTEARWHVPIVLAGLCLVVAIGSSRVILHVHYFSDVLAGWVSAIGWLALCIAGLESLRRRRGLTESRGAR